MITIPLLEPKIQLPLYHEYLQGDHDFRIRAEILNLSETVIEGEADILDGQVNITDGTEDGPERTASLTISMPDLVATFGNEFASDDTNTLWVARLVRIRHYVTVPGIGEVIATPLVGTPTAVSQSGAEVGLELADKSVLSDHGVRPATFKKGMNVRVALIKIIRDHGGEGHFRVPATKKTLSKSYAIGMGENTLTPWEAFQRIADAEMGWRAYYSCDGYATCEPPSVARTTVPVKAMLSLPDASTSFTDFSNYVKVTSKRKITNRRGTKKKSDDKTHTVIFEGVVGLPVGSPLSEQSLKRNDVVRTMPLVINATNYKTKKQVDDRAAATLKNESNTSSTQAYEIIPFFHLDGADKLKLPEGVGNVSLGNSSIPLGVGGNMTLGSIKWVSRTVNVRRLRSKKTVIRKKKKGGKKHRG